MTMADEFSAQKTVAVTLQYQSKGHSKAMQDIQQTKKELESLGMSMGKNGSIRDSSGKFAKHGDVSKKIGALKAQNAAEQKTMKSMYGLLGAMFLLAAVSGTIMGMLGPAAEAAGIMQIIGVILLLLFLPAMLYLLPIFLKLLDIVIKLPNSTKLFIGIFLIVIMLFAMLAGVLISLAIALPPLIAEGGAVAALAGLLGLTASEFLIVAAAIVVFIAILAGLLAVVTSQKAAHDRAVFTANNGNDPSKNDNLFNGYIVNPKNAGKVWNFITNNNSNSSISTNSTTNNNYSRRESNIPTYILTAGTS